MARLPPAPGFGSMTTGWPSVARIFSLTMRARMSACPPEENVSRRWIGLFGDDCADASVAPASSASAQKTRKLGVDDGAGGRHGRDLGHGFRRPPVLSPPGLVSA